MTHPKAIVFFVLFLLLVNACGDGSKPNRIMNAELGSLNGELTEKNAIQIAQMIDLEGLQGLQGEIGLYRHQTSKKLNNPGRCKVVRELGDPTDVDRDYIPVDLTMELECPDDLKKGSSVIHFEAHDNDDNDWQSGYWKRYSKVYSSNRKSLINEIKVQRVDPPKNRYKLIKRTTLCGTSNNQCSGNYVAIIRGVLVTTNEMPESMVKHGYMEGFFKGEVESLEGLFGLELEDGTDLIVRHYGSNYDFHDQYGPVPRTYGQISFEDYRGNLLTKRSDGWSYNKKRLVVVELKK